MTQRILQDIRTAKLSVSKAIDLPVKIAYALLRLTGGYVDKTARGKVAFSADEINRAVQEHLASRELEVPGIDFGTLIYRAIERMSSRAKLDYDDREMMRITIVQNLITGMNLDTGNTYGQGDLANRIREMLAKGLGTNDIKRILTDVMQKMFLTKTRYDRRKEFSGHEDGEEGTKRETVNLFDDVLSLNPMRRDQAAQWMSLSKQDPEIRNLLKQVDRIITQKADTGEALVWKTIRENPDYPSISQLEREIVTIMHPVTKARVTLSLSDAMTVLKDAGEIRTDNVRYVLEKKITPMLDRIKPVVLEALRERA